MARLLETADTRSRSELMRRRGARPAPRAAAPGADPHRHQARALEQPPAPGLPAQPTRRARRGGARACAGSASTAASSRSATTAAGFAFDNEGPRHRVYIEPFELASRPVTNGEFLAFIDDGGYRRPELWLSEGWATVQSTAGGAALLGATADGGFSGIHPRRHARGRSGRAGVPRQLLRGRRVSRAGRARACRPRTSGRSRPPDAADRGQLRRARRASIPRLRPTAARAACRSSSATSGSGRAVRTRPTRATARARARSASTTASSCATSSSCAAARARPRGPHPRDLPQLLPAGSPLAVHRPAPRPGHLSWTLGAAPDKRPRPAVKWGAGALCQSPTPSSGLSQGAVIRIIRRHATLLEIRIEDVLQGKRCFQATGLA